MVFKQNDRAEKSAKPYTAVVNGHPLYVKGYNWVPVDVVYGIRRREKLEHLIRLSKEAHSNIFRVWGGGNELQSENAGMIKDDEPVIAVLARVVKRLDGARYFLPSSPTGRIFNNTLENIEKDLEELHDVTD